MWKLRYYWPLAGFIVPSIVIGYGYVLPRHGLLGFNEVSLGFAATLASAAGTYIMGIATATGTSLSKSLRDGLSEYIHR